MTKDTENRAVGASAMRIRLEGALETLEKAAERYRWAQGVFEEPWRTNAGLHRKALERMRAEEPLVQQALEKTARMLQREGSPRDSEAAAIAGEAREARRELGARLVPLLYPGRAVSADDDLGGLLDTALLELLPPTRAAPMLTATLGNIDVVKGVPVLAAALLLAVGWVFSGSHVRWPFELAVMITGVVAPYLLWRNVTRVEVLPDRLRLKPFFKRVEEIPIPRGGVLYDPLEAVVNVAGFGPLTFHSVEDAGSLATLIELCRHPPFSAPAGTNTDGAVLDAEWNPAQPGALLITEDGAHFLLDGEATFDGAALAKVAWPNPKGRLLAQALLSLPPPARTEVLRRLRELGRALELRFLPDETVSLSRGVLRIGNRLKADVADRLAREIRGWVSAQRSRDAGER